MILEWLYIYLGKLHTEERCATDEMIRSTERNIQFTERDNILQEEVCRSLREQLQSQRDMNKATICTYEKVLVVHR